MQVLTRSGLLLVLKLLYPTGQIVDHFAQAVNLAAEPPHHQAACQSCKQNHYDHRSIPEGASGTGLIRIACVAGPAAGPIMTDHGG